MGCVPEPLGTEGAGDACLASGVAAATAIPAAGVPSMPGLSKLGASRFTSAKLSSFGTGGALVGSSADSGLLVSTSGGDSGAAAGVADAGGLMISAGYEEKVSRRQRGHKSEQVYSDEGSDSSPVVKQAFSWKAPAQVPAHIAGIMRAAAQSCRVTHYRWFIT